MPYLTLSYKQEIDEGRQPRTPGELNYKITRDILGYLAKYSTSYIIINDILGALEGAKLEFYRRVVVPHEEKKRAENGDVYP